MLQHICSRLFSNIRRCDTFGRLDQRTFALLMPRTSPEKGRAVHRRLQKLLDEGRFERSATRAEVSLETIDLTGRESLAAPKLLQWILQRLQREAGLRSSTAG